MKKKSNMMNWFKNHPKFQQMMDEAAKQIQYDYEVLGKQYTTEDIQKLTQRIYDKYGNIEMGVLDDTDSGN